MSSKEKALILDKAGIDRALTRVAHEILEKNKGARDIVLVGIQRGGVHIARRLAARIHEIEKVEVPVGSLDITMYRDDLSTRKSQPVLQATDISFDITDKIMVLVDDVVFTGRTIRAALNSIMDYGRPKRIQLAVLVDRGHRELPIRADYVGKNLPTSAKEKVEVMLAEDGVEEKVVILGEWSEESKSDSHGHNAKSCSSVAVRRLTMALSTKDLLGIKGMTADEIKLILDTAATFKDVSERDIKKVPALRGKTVINLFYEASTRTRTSFELAGKRLSADVINISTSTSSVVKGETLLDTARNIEAMKCDMIIVRHSCSGAPEYLSKRLKSSVINAGDGSHEHPTQALLDMFTIREKLGRLEGLTVAIVGDIMHSRVARSNIYGLTTMGAKVTGLRSADHGPAGHRKLGAQVSYDMDKAVEGADVVMMLRLQLERQTAGLFPGVREYARLFGLNQVASRAGGKTRARHAPRPHEPGSGDIVRRGGPCVGDPRPGDERRGGAHGGDVPACRAATKAEA